MGSKDRLSLTTLNEIWGVRFAAVLSVGQT